jgi:succinylglutamate desuccinylase
VKNKILVIGGLHGDEPLGIDLVNLFRDKPISGIDGIFGNPMATATKSRYIDKDLNRVFPGILTGCVEEIRAFQIMELSKNYDIVLDIHNTTSPNNDCGFVGGGHTIDTLKISKALGLNKFSKRSKY